jgi:hypothetical protein
LRGQRAGFCWSKTVRLLRLRLRLDMVKWRLRKVLIVVLGCVRLVLGVFFAVVSHP